MTVGSGLHGLVLRCTFAGCNYKLHFSAFHFFLTWRPIQITPLQAPYFCLHRALAVLSPTKCQEDWWMSQRAIPLGVLLGQLASVPPAMLAFGQSWPAMSQLQPLTSWGLPTTLSLFDLKKEEVFLLRGKINRSHNTDRILEILSVFYSMFSKIRKQS